MEWIRPKFDLSSKWLREYTLGEGSIWWRYGQIGKNAMWKTGSIDGVILKSTPIYKDSRGWLCEFFRHDDIPKEFHPVMGYLSMTEPDIARGPHEHHEQADLFCFFGPSDFEVWLWDNRSHSNSYQTRQILTLGMSNPAMLIVPPGVVHAYRNVGKTQGLVYNFANQLYKGPGRKDEVDEIRHEVNPDSPYHLKY